MVSRFDTCINKVLNFEGVFSDHPADLGGKTKYGITQSTLSSAFRAGIVKHDNIQALTVQEAKLIYKANYWDRCKCDELPAPLDFCVFDTAVNCGPAAAIKFLQIALNKINNNNALKVDGIIGDKTMNAIKEYLARYRSDCTFPILFLCDVFLDRRLQGYSDIVAANSSQMVFLRGWINRILDVKKVIMDGKL